MIDDDAHLIDPRRSARLCDLGADYIAAVTIANDGTQYLVLARRDSIGDHTAQYDADCEHVEHEQLGPLPMEFVRRIAISRRNRGGVNG